MKCYLFDIDLIERSSRPSFPKLPNHALLKFTSYFKQKGYQVELVYLPKQIPLLYNSDNVYIGSALYTPNLNRFKKRLNRKSKYPNQLKLEHIHIGTPTDSCWITDIPGLKCDYSEYDKMIEKDNIRLDWYPVNVGFLTRGCKRHCDYCVNRDKNEITPVNTLSEIYVKKDVGIELLDDNLLASDNAVLYFESIAEFYRKHKVPIKLRNGLDCRVVSEDKIKALSKASPAFDTFHCAWDDVKNTYIFRNMLRIKKAVKSRISCYMIYGVDLFTEEDLRRDLLGFFYRYYLLTASGITPIIQLYEDDRQEYENPYWNHCKLIKKQYNFQRQSKLNHIKRGLNVGYYGLVDEIIEIMGDYSYLTRLPKKDVLAMPDFNDKMADLASELNIKHVNI